MVRKKTIRFVWLLLLWSCLPLWAEEPSFHLAEIRLEGMRENVEGILLAESRLQPNKTYSESALFDAMVRLQRLPFVLDAEFRLEKGPKVQTYVLVIMIQTTKRLFFNAETTFIYRYNDLGDDFSYRESYSRDVVSLGARFFPSSKSQAYVAVNPAYQFTDLDEEAPLIATAGFAHYDLGGPGHFFNVEMFYSEGKNRIGTFPDESTRLTEGETAGVDLLYAIPLKRNQWLRAGAGVRHSELSYQTLRLLREAPFTERITRINERDLKYLWVDWERNTLNDHTLPTRGHRLRGGLAFIQDRIDFRFPDQYDETFIDNEDEIAAFFVYEHYWQVSPKQTWFMQSVTRTARENVESQASTLFGGPLAGGRVRKGSDFEFRQGLEAGYSLDLVTPPRINWVGDLRLELKLSSAIEQGAFDPISGENRIRETEDGIQNLSLGMIFRNIWGVVRLAFSYGWD